MNKQPKPFYSDEYLCETCRNFIAKLKIEKIDCKAYFTCSPKKICKRYVRK